MWRVVGYPVLQYGCPLHNAYSLFFWDASEKCWWFEKSVIRAVQNINSFHTVLKILQKRSFSIKGISSPAIHQGYFLQNIASLDQIYHSKTTKVAPQAEMAHFWYGKSLKTRSWLCTGSRMGETRLAQRSCNTHDPRFWIWRLPIEILGSTYLICSESSRSSAHTSCSRLRRNHACISSSQSISSTFLWNERQHAKRAYVSLGCRAWISFRVDIKWCGQSMHSRVHYERCGYQPISAAIKSTRNNASEI